jgi:hypothetical protein
VSSDPGTHDASNGDDLFDLPRDASNPPLAAEKPAVDAPGSALPRRAPPTGPAGPPISSVDSNAAALLHQVRRRQGKDEQGASAAPAAPVNAESRRMPRAAWIALAILGVANAATLALVVTRTPAVPAPVDAQPATAEHAPPTSVAGNEQRPAVRGTAGSTTENTLEAALTVLDEARSDLAAGRRSAARTRVGRLALSVDAVDASQRDELRAEIGLIIAQSLQADAEEARRYAR